MNYARPMIAWLFLAMAGCGSSTSRLQIAEPLGPEEEKAAIEAYQQAWAQGDGVVRDTPAAPPPPSP